jgi:hypothetical protein
LYAYVQTNEGRTNLCIKFWHLNPIYRVYIKEWRSLKN